MNRSWNPPHRSNTSRRTTNWLGTTFHGFVEQLFHRGRLTAIWAALARVLRVHRPSIRIDLERQRVHQRALRVRVEDGHAALELRGHPLIIVVEKREVLTARGARTGVSRGRETAIGLGDDADTIAMAREHRRGIIG